MMAETVLSKAVQRFILFISVLQGVLLYVAHDGARNGLWPFTSMEVNSYWYGWTLVVLTMLTFSVVRIGDKALWLALTVVSLAVIGLTAWVSWNATGMSRFDNDVYLIPFYISMFVLFVVGLPWLQSYLQGRSWRIDYSTLYDFTWSNLITLMVALIFVIVSWLILLLWGALFDLLNIDFFRQLFRTTRFIYLATAIMVGMGILISRTHYNLVKAVRNILFIIVRSLLPLLAFISLIFLVTLLFTGLQPLSDNWSVTSILTLVIVVMLLFVNSNYQGGEMTSPYSPWMRWLIGAAILSLPIYALLAGYSLWLRIDQYGWSVPRFWAVVLVMIATISAFSYAWAVLRQGKGGWLSPLANVNKILSLLVIAVVMMVNSPILDPYRITVSNQIQRLNDGRIKAADLDLFALRFEMGRQGNDALQALQSHPQFVNDPKLKKSLEEVLQQKSRWSGLAWAAPDEDLDRVTTIEEARQRISVAPGSVIADDRWWQTLLDTDNYEVRGCLDNNRDCVVNSIDLNNDGNNEHLLCALSTKNGYYNVRCMIFELKFGDWRQVGDITMAQYDEKDIALISQAIRQGQLQPEPKVWMDVKVGDKRLDVRSYN